MQGQDLSQKVEEAIFLSRTRRTEDTVRGAETIIVNVEIPGGVDKRIVELLRWQMARTSGGSIIVDRHHADRTTCIKERVAAGWGSSCLNQFQFPAKMHTAFNRDTQWLSLTHGWPILSQHLLAQRADTGPSGSYKHRERRFSLSRR